MLVMLPGIWSGAKSARLCRLGRGDLLWARLPGPVVVLSAGRLALLRLAVPVGQEGTRFPGRVGELGRREPVVAVCVEQGEDALHPLHGFSLPPVPIELVEGQATVSILIDFLEPLFGRACRLLGARAVRRREFCGKYPTGDSRDQPTQASSTHIIIP